MMFSLTCFNRRFTPPWTMFAITVIAVVFLMKLGFWQMTRAEEKQSLLSQSAAQAEQEPIPWNVDEPHPKAYQRIQLSGHYLPDVLLLDNQSSKHRFGYHVLSPLQLTTQQVVLIDRGWIAGDPARMQMPLITTPEERQTLSGTAYYPSDKVWVLGQAVEKKAMNLWVIEQIEPKWISELLHKSVYPFIMRLDPDADHGFERQWPIVALSPTRHYAYAVQWFAMAFVVFILFFVLNTKRLS